MLNRIYIDSYKFLLNGIIVYCFLSSFISCVVNVLLNLCNSSIE